MAIEHAGSTAWVGGQTHYRLLCCRADVAPARAALVQPPARLGYFHWSENPNTDRLVFVKGLPPHGQRRTHHLHVAELGGDAWLGQSASATTCDCTPNDAKQYLDLKLKLAKEYRSDREAYTAAKAAIVAEITRKSAV